MTADIDVLADKVLAVLDLHQPTEYRYEDDADLACTVCGVVLDWPCRTVALLTQSAPSEATP